MFTRDQYELLDFGDGRKLERFGAYTLDRPAPAAEDIRRAEPGRWGEADARFTRTDPQRGCWHGVERLPERWTITHDSFSFELKPTEFGHLGLFPEQAENWDWIGERVRQTGRKPRVLNLFAYTGGSTLAAAAAGAEVTHIEAAKNIVAWARRNAEQSGLAEVPIRWIAEDATKFVQRELRRGNRYDAVILDPPSYGHGPRGEPWRLAKHLPALLRQCGELTADRRAFLLVTCHSPGLGPTELTQMVRSAIPNLDLPRHQALELTLTTADGRRLPSGVVARWSAHEPHAQARG